MGKVILIVLAVLLSLPTAAKHDNGPFYNKQVAATLATLMGITYQPEGWEIGLPLFFVNK